MILRKLKNIGREIERFVVYRILHADDTPHRLALAVALGIFVAWTPTLGFQMVLVIALASLLRVNRLVGVPLVWISNPLTVAPVYYPSYLLGRFLLGRFTHHPAMNYEQLSAMVANFRSFGYIVAHLFRGEFWRELIHLLVNVGVELWVGSLIVATVLGVISYVVSYKVIVWYRTQHPRGRRHVRQLKRKQESSHVEPTS